MRWHGLPRQGGCLEIQEKLIPAGIKVSGAMYQPRNKGIPSYVTDKHYIETSQPSGHYMYHQFNIKQFHVLSTQCIYVFCVDLRTNSDYFTVQH